MRTLLLLLSAMVLAACSQLFDPPDNATKLAALQKQLSQITSDVAKLEIQVGSLRTASSGEWVLWYSEMNLQNSLISSGITPQSAYPTKEECLTAAQTWSLPGGKVIGLDPYVIETKTIQVMYRCLPRDIKP